MIVGFTPFTFVHVAVSLLAIVAGLVVLHGLLNSQRRDRWTLVFLITTIYTNASGFGFPFFGVVLPSHIIAGISLVLLAIAVVARYPKAMAGSWRWIYVVSAVGSLYLNVFVLIVQLFRRVPALAASAPTQSEPPFAIAQGVAFLLFAWLGVKAVRQFRLGGPNVGSPVARGVGV